MTLTTSGFFIAVDATVALKCLNDALKFHYEIPMFQEVRTFLDNYLERLVSILLYRLNMGDIDKENVRTCLESVIGFVIDDLTSHTFPVLASIFDKAEGYNEFDRVYYFRKEMIRLDGFASIGSYLLRTRELPAMPPVHSISTILILADECYAYCSLQETILIAKAAMSCLLSLVSLPDTH